MYCKRANKALLFLQIYEKYYNIDFFEYFLYNIMDKKMNWRIIMKKYLLLILLTLSLLLVGCGTVELKKSTPSDGFLTNQLTVKEMKQDLKFYVEFVKEKHAKFDHKLTEEEFDNEIKTIKSNLDNMSSDEFVFEIMKLQAKLGDGNSYTTLDSTRLVNRKYLPFEVKKFAEGTSTNRLSVFMVLMIREFGS